MLAIPRTVRRTVFPSLEVTREYANPKHTSIWNFGSQGVAGICRDADRFTGQPVPTGLSGSHMRTFRNLQGTLGQALNRTLARHLRFTGPVLVAGPALADIPRRAQCPTNAGTADHPLVCGEGSRYGPPPPVHRIH